MKIFSEDYYKKYLVWALLFLLIVNTVIVGGTYYLFRTSFPGAAARYSSKQEVARDLATYHLRLAEELEVLERDEVKKALAGFNYDVEVSSADELTMVIFDQGRKLREIILREADLMVTDQILAAINSNEQVRKTEEVLYFSLRFSEGEIFTIPGNVLPDEVITAIQDFILRDRLTMNRLEIEIAEGKARLAPYSPEEQLEIRNEELRTAGLKMHDLKVETGLAEMTGAGITVKLYDEFGATSSSSIIHDTDIRDVINELFGSGARGISLGGQRLIVTSAVRCSGSLIKVNDRLITVNPVVIQAVGDPDLLVSGLEIIRNNLEINRGIRFVVEREQLLKLPAYSRTGE
ncbi:MAG: DUF881 domain-containing protein [Firmicutes bacterium]|nr:DUF881 domain-containing protein [Bacillota bacterium]